jgi:hypothetical protein
MSGETSKVGERGAAALAEAMRCKTHRERWTWIASYIDNLPMTGHPYAQEEADE